MSWKELKEDFFKGNKKALAKVISLIEDHHPESLEIIDELYTSPRKAWIIGITGAPGTGKSTLVDCIAKGFRERGKTVAVIAVDPTSPFSGGAILGDRIRMQRHFLDAGVFIRSMASRYSLGGLAATTGRAVVACDAFGFDYVLVETVGAGQAEVDIVTVAMTTIVVLTPGFGDEIQSLKAGIMEIADIYVVNKGDLEGAERLVRELEIFLSMAPLKRTPPVILTTATRGDGIDKLMLAIDEHVELLKKDELLKNKLKAMVEQELDNELNNQLLEEIEEDIVSFKNKILPQILERKVSPYKAAKEIIANLNLHNKGKN